jgi:hypothetical protein
MLKASTSILDSFLFNPTTRVYNLRLLILVTVALIPIVVVFRAVPAWYNVGYAVFYDADEPILSIVSSSVVLVQQVGRCVNVTAIFFLRIGFLSEGLKLDRLLLNRGLRAVYDWCLNLAVICGMSDTPNAEDLTNIASSRGVHCRIFKRHIPLYSRWRQYSSNRPCYTTGGPRCLASVVYGYHHAVSRKNHETAF